MGILLFIKKMKVFAGLVACAAAAPAPAPVIIGGKDAKDGDFPHQVSLKRASGSHFCGGSVINTNKVMCAAHCKQSTTNYTAGAGSATLANQRQKNNVASQMAHPQYNAQKIDHDYMVITIQGSWNYNDYVQPIPIVSAMNDELPNGTPCQTSGYGYSEYILGQPAVIAPILQWIDVQCITNDECKKTWRLQTLTSRQQCAEVADGTSCMGDSGGPLTMMENGKKVLLGNVSWGHSGCASNGYPSCYSRNADPESNAWIKTNADL